MKRILIVDDEEALLASLKRTLRKTGYLIDFALDGQQALHLLKGQQKYDLLITDIYMPFDGLQLLEKLHAAAVNIPVILMSGGDRRSGSKVLLSTFEGYGITTKLSKPFSEDELLNAIGFALSPS